MKVMKSRPYWRKVIDGERFLLLAGLIAVLVVMLPCAVIAIVLSSC